MDASGKEKQLLRDIFETEMLQRFPDAETLPVIDAFSQFSQNPTSASGGYGIEENYPLIGENLKKRYNLGNLAITGILAFLKENLEKMSKANYDVYFWRNTIADCVKSKYTGNLLQWFESLYEHLEDKEKQMFLFMLYALRFTTSIIEIHRWFSCFFDKEEILSQPQTTDILIRWGLGNSLYYRSSRESVEYEFIVSPLIESLRDKFKEKAIACEDAVEGFFENLLIDNIKLLEKCAKQTPPVFENRLGRITQVASLVVESSKSYFGISPFALNKIRELIKVEKENLTKEWKGKFSSILNSFVKKNYPYANLKSIIDLEGAYCWEIRYVDAPQKTPVSISIVLLPYFYPVTQYSSIIDEIRRTLPSPLSMIFLIKETLPTIADAFRYVSEKNLIFLFDEESQKFYLMERSGKLSEDVSVLVDTFLSGFLPFLESGIQIGMTLPAYLKDYMDNLRYLKKFPRLVSIRNNMLKAGPRLRESIREKLSKKYGDQWKQKVTEAFSESIGKWENRIRKRPDREKAKDFLDGATLGELVNVADVFDDVFGLDKNLVKGFLNILNQHRKVLEHPFVEPQDDLDEKVFKSALSALEYIDSVISST